MHLYAYLGVALAFSHQLATGTDFVGEPAARAYWISLYVITLAVLVVFRLGVPVARSLCHRLRVERVVDEAPGVVSIEIGGARLERLNARAGQFFTWRFLTRDRWWEAHPFSLSAAPDGRRLRITVKGLGDFTARLRAIPPGTRVIAEGPFGAFTTAARRRPRVALIAGGVGIAPIRALLEDMPGEPGDIAVVYRALAEEDVILRDELEALPRRRGAELHYVFGDHREATRSRPSSSSGSCPTSRARRLRLRAARDDRGDAGEPGALGRVAAPHRHRAVRATDAPRRRRARGHRRRRRAAGRLRHAPADHVQPQLGAAPAGRGHADAAPAAPPGRVGARAAADHAVLHHPGPRGCTRGSSSTSNARPDRQRRAHERAQRAR